LKRLVYFERFDDIRDAIQREHNIKHWSRAWKVRMIVAANPDWNDLLSDNHTVKTWMAGTSPAMTMLNAMPRSPQRLQFAGQRVSPLRDAAGAEADDEIAAAGNPRAPRPARSVDFCKRNHLAGGHARGRPRTKMIAVDALDRRLARRIDVGDDDGVGVV